MSYELSTNPNLKAICKEIDSIIKQFPNKKRFVFKAELDSWQNSRKVIDWMYEDKIHSFEARLCDIQALFDDIIERDVFSNLPDSTKQWRSATEYILTLNLP